MRRQTKLVWVLPRQKQKTERRMGLLDGKVALVTGAARGLGRECALLIAREGGKAVVNDVDVAGGEETVRMIAAAGGEAFFVRADVSSAADVAAMVEAAVGKFGALDGAINNAVLPPALKPLADFTEAEWDRLIAVNLTGVFLCMKYEIQAMLARGGGSIVNIGSGNEHGAAQNYAPYTAAKRGVLGLTAVAALDYGAQNIRINAVGSGVMVTPAMEQRLADNPAHKEFLQGMAPMQRYAHPAEVAEAAIWLLSDRASFVHGHTLVADGGISAGKPMR
jgi:NAD(P)-dependent dehydrogenase (short-subunit alcohol dehydrogenase family)